MQLYQFDVILIRQVCTLRIAHHANEYCFVSAMTTTTTTTMMMVMVDILVRSHFAKHKELQRIIILTKQRQTKNTVVWKIKSRIPHNDSFYYVQIVFFDTILFYRTWHLWKGRQQRNRNESRHQNTHFTRNRRKKKQTK